MRRILLLGASVMAALPWTVRTRAEQGRCRTAVYLRTGRCNGLSDFPVVELSRVRGSGPPPPKSDGTGSTSASRRFCILS
jgi:hypothetical protein